jgi:diadenosine tetraphosphate (Ap4A) HIT family hydrolase
MAHDCLICKRVEWWRRGENPYFVREFEHSILVVGDHQFHRGYCLVLLKEHVRELHELDPLVQGGLWQEVMCAGQAVVRAFQPWKMNYACYGNAEPHVHWHLFPRYDTEPDHTRNPWLHCDQFKQHRVTHDAARQLVERVRAELLDER